MDHIKNATKPEKPDAPAPKVIAASLRDPNQIAALSSWDLDIRQLRSGPMQTDIRVRPGRHVSIMGFRFSRRVHQFGVSPQGHMTFGIPTRSRLSDWRGKEVETPPFLSFGSGHEFDCVSDCGFGGYTLTIDTENAFKIGDRLGIPLPAPDHGTFITATLREPELFADLVASVGRLMEHMGDVSEAEEVALIEGLMRIATGAHLAPERCRQKHSAKGLSKAIEMMTENVDENLPISSICDQAGVSLRTLERAFKEKFGIGPKAYYTRLRLGRVRSLIIEAGRDLKVSDAANRYGFWHIGQFSKDYRRSFGELPSETLNGATGFMAGRAIQKDLTISS